MKGSSLYFARQINDIKKYDLIFATDLINISDLEMLLGENCPPVILYFHENQLAYPLNSGETLDYHYGLTDLTNALGAERVVFNSNTHMKTFLTELPPFIRHMPDTVPLWSVEKIRQKFLVIYPGIDDLVLESSHEKKKTDRIPVIVWNHRWEYDKNPEDFFTTLFQLKKEGIPFKLILLGEKYSKYPRVFKTAEKILKVEIVHSGYADSYMEYLSLLRQGDIVISTAHQENYGISIVEAILSGCTPLLPDRLSYPEIIPEEYHGKYLYSGNKDLLYKLKLLLTKGTPGQPKGLTDKLSRFCWSSHIINFDNLFLRILKAE